MQTVMPVYSDEILINPGKGYVLYDWAFLKKDKLTKEEEKSLSLSSCLLIKKPWAAVQPNSEDEILWEVFDEPIALAKKWGKRVSFGFGTLVSTGGAQEGVRSLVPQWVYDAGAKYHDLDCANFLVSGKKDVNRIPEWTDEIFREKFEKFVEKVAKRYDGNPYIEFVANFSHGNWGEWHHYDMNNLPVAKGNLYVDFRGEKVDMSVLGWHVDLYGKYFKKSRLILPTNVHDRHDELEDFCRYAVEKYGYGLKREGLITIPECTYAMRAVAGRAPAVGEWQSGYTHYKADERWSDDLLDKTFIYGKLTHTGLGYYGEIERLSYLREKEAQIRYWGNRMGYFYVLKKVSFPSGKGETGDGTITIENLGVAPAYLPIRLFIACKKGKRTEKKYIDVNVNAVGEKQEKSFSFPFPVFSFSGALFLGAETEDGTPVRFANVSEKDGTVALKKEAYRVVHFDGRPWGRYDLSGAFENLKFTGVFKTFFKHDCYRFVCSLDGFEESCEGEIEFPIGGVFSSFTAYGYGVGTISIETEYGEKKTVRFSEKPTEFSTGFKKESGKVKVRVVSGEKAWSVFFTELKYKVK